MCVKFKIVAVSSMKTHARSSQVWGQIRDSPRRDAGIAAYAYMLSATALCSRCLFM